MVIKIAKLGRIGIIHYFLNIDDYVEDLRKLKKEKLLVGAAVIKLDIASEAL